MTKIIGIDPGLASTGVGIVSGKGTRVESYSYGSIHTSKKKTLPSRLDQIFSKIFLILKNENPDVMVVEDIFSLEKYPKSGITLGKVTGVILLAGCRLNVPVIEIPVREAKKVLTGNGKADKIQLEKSVRHLLNLKSPIRPFHASDAIALALIGFFRYQNGLKHDME
ncbi:MAG: crossover junction endodeoxyribonuclease RuvC [Desulfobacterales bacterium]|nr:crossover junction endodeoxyribonuclease RuvC [Desulfobacterales bacterium]